MTSKKKSPGAPAEATPGRAADELEDAPAKGAKKEQEGLGRSCQECGTKLSAYNPNPYCWQHAIGRPWRGPTAKPPA